MKKIVLVFLFFPAFVFAEGSVMVSQYDGFADVNYVFSEEGIAKVSNIDGEAKIIDETRIDVKHAVAFGQSDIAVFTKDGTIYCFHTITSTLRQLRRPAKLTVEMESTLTAEQAVELFGTSKPDFGVLNYSILGVYLVVLVVMGFYFSKGDKTTEDFFLAGRRIPAWAAGVSIFGTSLI